MAIADENIEQSKVEENPDAGTVSEEKPAAKKRTAARKARASKSAAKKTGAAKTISAKKPAAKNAEAPKIQAEAPKLQAEAVAAEKTEGAIAHAIRGTFFTAGRLISKTKSLKNIGKIVNWAPIFTGAKTVLNSTKEGVLKVGGSIKGAVTVEKITDGTKKVWSSTKESALKLKNAVPMEKISAETRKVWDATKQGAVKVGGTVKNAVPVEKIKAGTKQAWTSTQQGVSTISRNTATGLSELGKSFKAGYQSEGEKEAAAQAEAPVEVVSAEVEAPAPEETPVDVAAENPSTELKPGENESPSVRIEDAELEKEVNQIVSEIAEI